MDTMTAIRTRKSFRGPFMEDKRITREDLQEIVEAGAMAPSGCNLQTTEFIGVDDPQLVKELAVIYGKPWAEGSTAAVLLLSKETPSPSGVSYHIHDYSAAAENIYLAATEKGIGTVWIEGQIHGEKAEKMASLLGVPKDMTIFVYMPLGYPAEEGPHKNKIPLKDRMWFNGYKNS